MGRRRVTLNWANQRARRANIKTRLAGLIKKTNELTILCDVKACLVVFDREEDQVVVWPSTPEAKSLINNYYSLAKHERNKKAADPESFIQANIQKLEKKMADTRDAIEEFEMDNLMSELNHGRKLVDLSRTEIDKLLSYTGKRIMSFRRKMGSMEHLNHVSFDEAFHGEATLRAFNVSSAGWDRTASVYYFDDWRLSCLPTMITRSDQHIEPIDADEDLGRTSNGESSKAFGGAEDDAE
ncbi:agamous-like MADS-box protein AGL86 [Capsella rubella]|uniref:agamous-like MADS-box protein AGL86 n=1 Tax=Capsella rubella TaxID=81985 RepID=UPI000CD5678A|nr:agamous-like MADS-box protein AGL86 [Capsella rubella]